MSGRQCSISWCRVETRAAVRLDSLLSSEAHTCEPGQKDAASSQDLGIAVCVARHSVAAGTFQEGLAVSFNMQLLQGVHHLRRDLLRPEGFPQRHHLAVSRLDMW